MAENSKNNSFIECFFGVSYILDIVDIFDLYSRLHFSMITYNDYTKKRKKIKDFQKKHRILKIRDYDRRSKKDKTVLESETRKRKGR